MSKCAQCGKEHAGDGVLCLQCWTTNQAKPKAYTETCVECGRRYQETSQLNCICPSCTNEQRIARSFGGVSPRRPPKNYAPCEPPFEQVSVRICRVCGLEYFETPCLQTHVCHACRLPAVTSPPSAGCFWQPIATVPCDGAVYLFVNAKAKYRLPWLGCNPRYFYGPDTCISGPSGDATHWASLPPLPLTEES